MPNICLSIIIAAELAKTWHVFCMAISLFSINLQILVPDVLDAVTLLRDALARTPNTVFAWKLFMRMLCVARISHSSKLYGKDDLVEAHAFGIYCYVAIGMTYFSHNRL